MEESKEDAENVPHSMHMQGASKINAKKRPGFTTSGKDHAKTAKEVPRTKTALQVKPINSARQAVATAISKKTSKSTIQATVKPGKAGDAYHTQRITPPVSEESRGDSQTLQAATAPHPTPIKGDPPSSLNSISPSPVGMSPQFGKSSRNDMHEDLYRILDVRKSDISALGPLAQSPEKRIRTLQTELQTRKRDLEALTARASAERAELLARQTADREAYDRIIQDAEATIANLRSQLESRCVHDSDLQGDRTVTTVRIEELETLLRNKEAEIRNLTERLHLALNSRVPKLELEIAIQERDSFAAELEETRALLSETKAYLEEMEQREARIVELEGELIAKERRIIALEQERVREEDRRLELEKHVDELEAAVEDLIEENEQLHVKGTSFVT